MDWHVQLHPNERRQVMARVAQALRQAQPNYAPQQIAQVAQNFERHLHSTATSKEDYFITCRSRLATMEQKARMGTNMNANNGPIPIQINQQPGTSLAYDQQVQQANMQNLMSQRQMQPGPNMNPNVKAQMDARALLMQQQQSMLQRTSQQGSPMVGMQKNPMSTLNQPITNIGSPYQQQSATMAMPQQNLQLSQRQGQQQQHQAMSAQNLQAMPMQQQQSQSHQPQPQSQPLAQQVSQQQNGGLSISNPNGVPSAAQMTQIHRMLQAVQSFRARMDMPPLEAKDTTPPQVMKQYAAMKQQEAQMQQSRQAQPTQMHGAQASNLAMQHASMMQTQYSQGMPNQPQMQRPVPQNPQNPDQSMQQMHMQAQANRRQQNQAQVQAQAQAQQLQSQQQLLPPSQPVPGSIQTPSVVQRPQSRAQNVAPPVQSTGQGPQALKDASNPFGHPIPPPLLARLSFLPPGANTWMSIMDLGKKKLLNAQQIDQVRQVYSIHQKVLANYMAAQNQSQQPQGSARNPLQQQQLQQLKHQQQQQHIQQQQQHQLQTQMQLQRQQQLQQQQLQQQQQQQQQQLQQQQQNHQLSQPPGQRLVDVQNFSSPIQPLNNANGAFASNGQPLPYGSFGPQGTQSVQNLQTATPKRKTETSGAQHKVSDSDDSPTKRRKAGDQTASALGNPQQAQTSAIQPPVQEKGQMMQLLLNSCPVPEQVKLRKEVALMEEQISARPRNYTFKNLSEPEKAEVRKQVASMAPYCARVDQLTTIYYIVSKNTQAVRQLLEMKYLFRDHLSYINQGHYVLDVKDLMKLKVNCDKMFASVKEHLTNVAKAVQARNQDTPAAMSPTPDGVAATFNKGFKPEDLKLPASRKKGSDASLPLARTASQIQADKLRAETAKAAAQAAALIKKEAEADPLAWVLKQVDAFYISNSPPKSNGSSVKITDATPSTILKTPAPFVAANTPNSLAKQLVSQQVGAGLPPTPPRSDRLSTRVLGESLLEDESGILEFFLHQDSEVKAPRKGKSSTELLDEIGVEDNLALWGMRMTSVPAL